MSDISLLTIERFARFIMQKPFIRFIKEEVVYIGIAKNVNYDHNNAKITSIKVTFEWIIALGSKTKKGSGSKVVNKIVENRNEIFLLPKDLHPNSEKDPLDCVCTDEYQTELRISCLPADFKTAEIIKFSATH